MLEAVVVADVMLDSSDQFVFVGSLEAESASGTRGSEVLVARHRTALLDLGEAMNRFEQLLGLRVGFRLIA